MTQTQSSAPRRMPGAAVPTSRTTEAETTLDDADALLDEIDTILDDQEQLQAFRQRGGQ